MFRPRTKRPRRIAGPPFHLALPPVQAFARIVRRARGGDSAPETAWASDATMAGKRLEGAFTSLRTMIWAQLLLAIGIASFGFLPLQREIDGWVYEETSRIADLRHMGDERILGQVRLLPLGATVAAARALSHDDWSAWLEDAQAEDGPEVVTIRDLPEAFAAVGLRPADDARADRPLMAVVGSADATNAAAWQGISFDSPLEALLPVFGYPVVEVMVPDPTRPWTDLDIRSPTYPSPVGRGTKQAAPTAFACSPFEGVCDITLRLLSDPWEPQQDVTVSARIPAVRRLGVVAWDGDAHFLSRDDVLSWAAGDVLELEPEEARRKLLDRVDASVVGGFNALGVTIDRLRLPLAAPVAIGAVAGYILVLLLGLRRLAPGRRDIDEAFIAPLFPGPSGLMAAALLLALPPVAAQAAIIFRVLEAFGVFLSDEDFDWQLLHDALMLYLLAVLAIIVGLGIGALAVARRLAERGEPMEVRPP